MTETRLPWDGLDQIAHLSQPYLRHAGRLARAALLLRLATMPPADCLGSAELAFAGSPRLERQYALCRRVAVVTNVLGLARSPLDAPGLAEIFTAAAPEAVISRELRGFAPYYQHLYLYAGLVHQQVRSTRGVAYAIYVPHVVYFASGLLKLRLSAEQWLGSGVTLDNALHLYGNDSLSARSLRRLPRPWLARAALSFELGALPLSLTGRRGLLAASVGALGFHAMTARAMRISFWHLAFMHLPAILAIRDAKRRRPSQGRRRP